ncbi:MAG: hypothetical protein KGJ37_04560, partial [Verrucomicrobiota bacterium]|nr:hypothetical protein [Verrucomicrobiota bacterium]
WARDDDGNKFQVCAELHGGNLPWQRKSGHHQSWEPHSPADEDWDKLFAEAARRVPRRLISQKQFDEIKRLRPF